jgi:hypothetical protein
MDRFQQKVLGILDRGRRQIGETIHPAIKHAPVIDDTFADLAGFRAMTLQGPVGDTAILRRLGQ